MNQDDILKMARDSGMELYGLGRDRRNFVFILERFAALVAEPLQARIKDLYRQLDEAEKRLDEQYKMGMEYKLDECILILERLYERSGEQYKQYLHAAKVLKGEV
jgi:hypothetical protein